MYPFWYNQPATPYQGPQQYYQPLIHHQPVKTQPTHSTIAPPLLGTTVPNPLPEYRNEQHQYPFPSPINAHIQPQLYQPQYWQSVTHPQFYQASSAPNLPQHQQQYCQNVPTTVSIVPVAFPLAKGQNQQQQIQPQNKRRRFKGNSDNSRSFDLHKNVGAVQYHQNEHGVQKQQKQQNNRRRVDRNRTTHINRMDDAPVNGVSANVLPVPKQHHQEEKRIPKQWNQRRRFDGKAADFISTNTRPVIGEEPQQQRTQRNRKYNPNAEIRRLKNRLNKLQANIEANSFDRTEDMPNDTSISNKTQPDRKLVDGSKTVELIVKE